MKKNLSTVSFIIFSMAIGLALSSCSSNAAEKQNQEQMAQKPKVESVIKNWPETSQKVARDIVEKYGQPAEMTPTHLIWYKTGPWKRTIVYKEEVPHHFPKKHTDVLEQTIDYQYPVDKYDEMTAYDGSVFAERTRGELSARCDLEAMNYLALNLAHDIAEGKKTVEEARLDYAENVMKFMEGQKTKYTQGFAFKLPEGDQRDPDEPMMEKVMARGQKKGKK